MRLLAFLCLFILPVLALSTPDPELLLAKRYDDSIDISQYWVSEKYDGVRALWDGNQLISREGYAFHAPEWFIHDFPAQQLDGELWIARQQFEQVVSTVSKGTPVDKEWRRVKFMVFELPEADGTFTERIRLMRHIVARANTRHLRAVEQFRVNSHEELLSRLRQIVKAGAEGLMLHRADARYVTGRSDALLKLKMYEDAEATVLAHLPGKGKYNGLLGALLVENAEGMRFRVGTGFTDEERKRPPPVGSTITYKFFGKTRRGIPRFASFLRIRTDRIESSGNNNSL